MGALNQQSIRHSHYVKKHAEQTENIVAHFHSVLHLYHKASNQLVWMELRWRQLAAASGQAVTHGDTVHVCLSQ